MNELGALLRQLRGKRSLREVADISGVSHNYLSIVEKGVDPRTKTPVSPSPETLKKLSEAYSYDYGELMRVAGYIDNLDDIPNYTEMINEFLDVTLKQIGFTDSTLSLWDLEEKIQAFFTATDDGTRIKIVEDEQGKKHFSIGSTTIDIKKENIIDSLDLEYDGMKLTKEEKEEFIALARGFFGARKALKGKD